MRARFCSSATIRSFRRFALDLIGSGPKHLKSRLEAKLPTGALVVMRFLVGAWNDVS